MLTATSNVYGPGVWTGITYGDLREILRRRAGGFFMSTVPPTGKRGDDGMEDYRAQISKGAAALVKGGVVTDRVTGDVLYDHDWTPMEAAEVVLDAVNHRGAVEALEKADALADAVIRWKSHVALEGLVGEYMSARHLRGGR